MTRHSAVQVSSRPWPLRVAVVLARGFGRVVQGLGASVVLAALVVGIPWGLVHYIGWPLPDHVPTWGEVQATLLNPMSPQFLLSFLACVIWPIWARFTWDVTLSGVDAARLARWPEVDTGPLRAAAGVLVGAIVFSILGHRAAQSLAPATPVGDQHSGSTVAAAPLVPGPLVRPLAFASPLSQQAVPQAHPVAAPGTAIVRAPSGGVYDSLWRIAARELGDGARWPEIWAHNRGHTQTDGRVFRDPNHIRPGWTLQLPAPPEPPQATDEPEPGGQQTEQPAAPPPPTIPPPTSLPSTTAPSTPESTPTRPAAPQPSPANDPEVLRPHPGTGITVDTGAYVGLALAALITAALVTVRLRRRRNYRPGSGVRDEHTIAPIVRSLRIAYDHATLPRDDDGDIIEPDPPSTPGTTDIALRRRATTTATALLPTGTTTIAGLREGRPVALDLARTRGLGIVGPGAATAARALVVSLLAANQHHDAVVLVPAGDLRALFGEHTTPARSPGGLHVVDDLDSALDTLEAELLARIRNAATATTPPTTLVLVATPMPHADRRMQAIIDNGSTLGLAAVLIGQWKPGGTARVRADGTVSATSPDLADALAGTRLFTLPADDAAGLLDLLGEADDDHPVAPHPRTSETTVVALADKQDTNAAADPDRLEILAHLVNDVDHRQAPVAMITRTPRIHLDIPTPAAVMPPGGAPTAAASPPHEPNALAESERPPTDPVAELREPAPLELVVLGRPHLHHHGPDGSVDLIDAVAPKQREVLAYLSLHPGGARRETLAAAIWPDAPGDRPYNSFHATLSQLRRALRTEAGDALGDLVVNIDGHYGLDPNLVSVDLWQLQDALRVARHSLNEQQRQEALYAITDLHRGELGDGLTSAWLDAPRENLRRDVLDVLGALVTPLGPGQSTEKLTVLEQIRRMDPHNEAVYQDIIRTQAEAGHHHAIARTLAILTTALAEIDEEPSPDTLALGERLQRRVKPAAS